MDVDAAFAGPGGIGAIADQGHALAVGSPPAFGGDHCAQRGHPVEVAGFEILHAHGLSLFDVPAAAEELSRVHRHADHGVPAGEERPLAAGR
jgi:hypothetical protein